MKSIDTLIPDIYALIQRKDGWFDDAVSDELSKGISRRLRASLGERSSERPTLRLSKMGKQCPRALWTSLHHPEMGEPLPPWAEIKYTFGHILEALVICLARAAGHTVEGEQDAIKLDGIVGHRDCVIDGCLVDIKSASSRAIQKFRKNFEHDDDFGYLDQLDGYVVGSHEDTLVQVKDKGYIIAIDKQLGHMVCYEHAVREESIRSRIKLYKSIAQLSSAPDCECGTRPDGKSGNIGLDLKASYSPYKHSCFPRLRTFLYASGPVYLTKVVRKPDVPEVDRNGKIVYN